MKSRVGSYIIFLELSYGLRTINAREHRRLFKFTEEDKFIFSCLDGIVESLQREFKEFNKDFIVQALKMNTLNLPQTYEYLKRPRHVEKNIYNSGDDHVLKYMRETGFYKELVDLHGKSSVEDREFFLS